MVPGIQYVSNTRLNKTILIPDVKIVGGTQRDEINIKFVPDNVAPYKFKWFQKKSIIS